MQRTILRQWFGREGRINCRLINDELRFALVTEKKLVVAQVLPNGNLVFPPFRAEDYRQEVHAQVYSCLAQSPAGSVHSRDVNVRAGKCYPLT